MIPHSSEDANESHQSQEKSSQKNKFTFYVTNLPDDIDTLSISVIYRCRWAIERVFSLYKSWNCLSTGRLYYPDKVRFVNNIALLSHLSCVYFSQLLEKYFINDNKYLSLEKCCHLSRFISSILTRLNIPANTRDGVFTLNISAPDIKELAKTLKTKAKDCQISRASKDQIDQFKSTEHNCYWLAQRLRLNNNSFKTDETEQRLASDVPKQQLGFTNCLPWLKFQLISLFSCSPPIPPLRSTIRG